MVRKRVITIIVAILLTLSSCNVYATSKYNLRDNIDIKIENQGGTGACWALAMCTVLESNLALKNNIDIQMSARHMDYATSQSFIGNKTNELGFSKEVNTGGTPEIALAYLTNGSGPVKESDMPFSENFEDIELSEVTNKAKEFQVDKWINFPSIIKSENGICKDEDDIEYTTEQVNKIRKQIKEHIMQNGAVYSGIHVGTDFNKNYNTATYAYNCNDYSKLSDHAIIIIGWDDNYSKDNFNQAVRPKNNGAYIVQNSWGNDNRLNNGIFYVSYEDAIIEEAVYGIVDVKEKNYRNIYQYDELGRNQYLYVPLLSSVYGANVYERENIKEEVVTQVAVSTYMPLNCEIYINPNDGAISKEKLVKVGEGKLDPGYNTIYLDKSITLKGTKFAVVVKYKRIDDGGLCITTVSRHKDEGPYQNVTSKAGQSYMGITLSGMKDLATSGYENTNICIKAFTNTVTSGDVNGDGKITATDLSLLKLHIVNSKELEDISRGDINSDGKITATDLSLMKQIIVNNI